MRTRIRALTASLVLVGFASSAAAQGLTRNPSGLSNAELDARLKFIEERLDDGETYAKGWQWGWTSGYALGIVYGTGKAIDVEKEKTRVNYIVTAVKATIGTSRMLFWRLPGRNGADPMRSVEGDSRKAKLARLAVGEEMLQEIAKRAERRWDWRAHAANVALNFAGAGFTLGFGKDSDAWQSLGVGIGVGTVNILSAPKRGIQDLDDYETRFGLKTADRFDWSIVPTLGGAAIRVAW